MASSTLTSSSSHEYESPVEADSDIFDEKDQWTETHYSSSPQQLIRDTEAFGKLLWSLLENVDTNMPAAPKDIYVGAVAGSSLAFGAFLMTPPGWVVAAMGAVGFGVGTYSSSQKPIRDGPNFTLLGNAVRRKYPALWDMKTTEEMAKFIASLTPTKQSELKRYAYNDM